MLHVRDVRPMVFDEAPTVLLVAERTTHSHVALPEYVESASVLSWVSKLRPVVAQENCRLACTSMAVLRLPGGVHLERLTRCTSSGGIFHSHE
jgi:hypothetical protein